jgi:hypothetical protein
MPLQVQPDSRLDQTRPLLLRRSPKIDSDPGARRQLSSLEGGHSGSEPNKEIAPNRISGNWVDDYRRVIEPS